MKHKPIEWKKNLELVEKLIIKYNLTKAEIKLLVDLYQGYLYNWFKGFDFNYRDEMYNKAEKLRK